MRKLVNFFLAFIVSTPVFSQDLIIKDINIIPMTSDTVLTRKSVLIHNGRIKAIDDYRKLTPSKKTRIIDGAGKYLMPGLADMHVHLGEADRAENLLLSSVAAGITQIRIMNSTTNAAQSDLRKKLMTSKDLVSPKIHYSHLVRRTETFTETGADSLIQQLKADGTDFIKLLSLANEETFDNLTKAAKRHNIPICGHYPVYQKDGKSVMVAMEKVTASGFKSIEHLAGYVWLKDKEQIEQALKLTKENGIYNCPTLDFDMMAYDLLYPEQYKHRITYKLLPNSVTKDWQSSYAAAVEKAGGHEKVVESGKKYKPTFDLKTNVLKRLYENNCLLLIGGDAGLYFQADGFNIYEEMINWKNAGIDNFTILKSATVTPSQFFNEQAQWGTIETGKNAELIIIGKNPLADIKNITTVESTIMGGKIYDNKKLREKL